LQQCTRTKPPQSDLIWQDDCLLRFIVLDEVNMSFNAKSEGI